ncbi:MAG: DUF192 domain-containing protein [Leptolyngbya sp. RL_3_1]|nr:DUF192 domain-containing protein [Leptolyngbya sp. RL_3_1]
MVQRTQPRHRAFGRSRLTRLGSARHVVPWILGSCWAGLWLASAGCSPPPVSSEPIGEASSPQAVPSELLEAEPIESPVTPGQILPVSAEVELESGQVIALEVAETPQQQALGLMYRTSLPDDRGMLFPFDPPRPVSFWMRNVEIHLDMIFVRDGTVVAIAANVPPCTSNPCPTYGPAGVAVDGVIELRGERAAELGITVGSALTIRPLASEETAPEEIAPEATEDE